MNESCGHRRFAAFWEFACRHESQKERALRRVVASEARGRTLEIGFGIGSNWAYLPMGVEYTGIEPDRYMRERAAAHLPAGRDLTLLDGDAQALDFADGSFDTVIGTLVFCTIPDAGLALDEARRVLKPGGEFRFLEHVRANNRAGAVVQDVLNPLWTRLAGGCHPNRDTLAAMNKAGFEVRDVRNVKLGPLPAIVGSATPKPRA